MSKGKPFLFNMNNEIEIWKDVPGYEGLYKCSNFGIVKSIAKKITNTRRSYISKEKLIKQGINKKGYYFYRLCKNNNVKKFFTHQLVAMSFLNHIPNGMINVIDHIDNCKTNNNVLNLQIVSNRFNISKKTKKYTSDYTGVYWNKKQKKWHSQIGINFKKIHLGYYDSEIDAHLSYQNKLKEIEND